MNVHTKITRAFFVSAGKYKEKFKDAACVYPISVGQSYHEGEKFLATINLIDANFKVCDIVVCDSLQRHTIQAIENLSEDDAYKKAIELGNQWLCRNENHIHHFSIPCEIIRWDCWLKRKEYDVSKKMVDSLFLNNHEYKEAFIRTSKRFIDRYKSKQKSLIDYDFLEKKCIEYLKEECAVTLMWIEKRYNFNIYPGKRTEAMLASYHHKIDPISADLLGWIHINFKKVRKLYE
ncbi:MAG: hypothetical protein PVG30_05000 [Gammaproteobacteria bacterium]|jgi:tRNA-dependent cyclodipeptide synthase